MSQIEKTPVEYQTPDELKALTIYAEFTDPTAQLGLALAVGGMLTAAAIEAAAEEQSS